jgi:tetratricopeptide (TPR) repeat protein
MNADLRRRFVRDLVADLQQVGAARFEDMATSLDGEISGERGLSRGTNLEGASVSGTVDSVTPSGNRAVEAGSEKDYFKSPFSKIWHDLRHAIDAHPGATVVLYSNRECGPEASSKLTRLVRRLQRIGITLDWYDSRRICEEIVDNLLIRESAIERLKTFLPNLERISEQFAASNLLPPLDPEYRGRSAEESQILSRLNVEKSTAICGIGGQGKTELACAVAHKLADQHELVVWVQAEDVKDIMQLHAYDIRRNGYRHNLLGLLKSQSVLLILDNATVDLGMQRLVECCGATSHVIVTSQTTMAMHSYVLEPLSEGPDSDVLNAGVQQACPAKVLALIRKVVGGHPLVLRIINAHVRVDGHSWDEIAADCSAVAEFEDDRRQRIADRILERHIGTLNKEFAFILWCGSNTIDRLMLLGMLSRIGLTKLERRAFVTRSQSDVVRIHDIVYRSVFSNRNAIAQDGTFGEGLATYLAGVSHPKGLALFRVIHRHGALLEQTLKQIPRSDALRYAYTLAKSAKELNPSLLPDPFTALEELRTAQMPLSNLAVESALSLIEALYRHTRSVNSPAVAKGELHTRMPIYDQLLEIPGLSDYQRAMVRHHRGKSYLKLGEEAQARLDFENVLQGSHPLAATKLQLARLYRDNPERGKELIAEILTTAQTDPSAVSESIVLETIHTLRRKHLAQFLDEMSERFGIFIASRIKAAAFTGFDQPYEALTAAGLHWSFVAPDLLLNVMEELPIPPLEQLRGRLDLLFNIAEILKVTGKALDEKGLKSEALSRWNEAKSYYSAISAPDSYMVRGIAENLILLHEFEEASAILDQMLPVFRDQFWHHRRAQCWKGLGKLDEARKEIDLAIELEKDGRFIAAFYDLRAQIREAAHDNGYIDDLQKAIQMSRSELYTFKLRARLTN